MENSLAFPQEWDAFGFRFNVSANTPAVRAYLSVLFRDLSPASVANPYAGLSIIDLRDDAKQLSWGLNTVVAAVNLGSIEAAEGKLILHAGAVARPGGGCAILCAASGSGKSTLTARLVAEGLAYVTDETVCLDPHSLTITPYRKPLSLKPGSHHLFPELSPADELPGLLDDGDTWLVAPHRLGSAPLPDAPLRPEIVVFPTYSAEEEPSVRRLSEGETAFLMGRESSRLQLVRGEPLPVLARAARRIPGYRVIHRDHRSAAAIVNRLWDEVLA